MREPNKKTAGVNSRFATISEAEILEIQGDTVPESKKKATKSVVEITEYILKQLFFSISVNSGRIFTSPLRGSVNILPLFTSISNNNC